MDIKAFIKSTFIGGLLVILPVGLIVAIFMWSFGLIYDVISPISNFLQGKAGLNAMSAGSIAFGLVVVCFFLTGLVVQTQFGKFIDFKIGTIFMKYFIKY